MRIVASIQRKRVDAAAVHHLPEVGGFGFELSTLGVDGHGLRCLAGFQLQVHAHAILNVQFHRASNGLLESLPLDGNGVMANLERAGNVLSFVICGER